MNLQKFFSVFFVAAAASLWAIPEPQGLINVWDGNNGFTQLMPTPKYLKASSGKLTLPQTITYSAPDRDDIAIPQLTKELQKLGITLKRVTSSKKAFLKLELDGKTSNPIEKQAYELEIDDDEIEIEAKDACGLYYGVQTLCNLLRNSCNNQIQMGKIKDKPDLDLRGFYVRMSLVSDSDIPKFNRAIEGFAQMKMNWAILEFAHNLPLENDPFTQRKNKPLSDKALSTLVETCRKNHVEVTPFIQALTHGKWLEAHKDYLKMIEGDVAKKAKQWNVTMCPQNQQAYDLTMLCIKKATDYFKPRYFFVGLDEVQLGNREGITCPKCKGKDYYTLIKTYTDKLFADVFALGTTPMMWFDSFYEERFWHYNFFPQGNPHIDRIIPQLDRRIQLNYWNYNPHAREDIAQYYGKELGFAFSGASYSRHPLNTETMPRLIKKVNGIGCYITYWSHINSKHFITPEEVGNFAIYCTGIHANNCWNTSVPTQLELSYDPAYECRKALTDNTPVRKPGTPAVTIPITAQLNAHFGDNEEFPMLSTAEKNRLKNALASSPEAFKLTTIGNKYCGIILNNGNKEDNYPQGPVTIPVGRSFSGLSFLMTASRPNTLIEMTPEDYRINQAKPYIGSIEVKFQDGSKNVIPLKYRGSVVDWNLQCSSLQTRFIYRGRDSRNAIYSFISLDWDNPSPEKQIKELVFKSYGKDGIAPVIFAITGFNPKAGETAPATPQMELSNIPNHLIAPETDINDGFTPVASFTQGTMGKAMLKFEAAKMTGALAYKFVEDSTSPTGEKILEITIPPAKNSQDPARVWIDVRIPANITFDMLKNIIADCYLDHPEMIDRSAAYITDGAPADCACEAQFGIISNKPNQWQISVYQRSQAHTERGGINERNFKEIRISAWFSNTIPVKWKIGRLGLSQSTFKFRRSLFDGRYFDMWYPERKNDMAAAQ